MQTVEQKAQREPILLYKTANIGHNLIDVCRSVRIIGRKLNTLPRTLDQTDLLLIAALRREPRASHAQLARMVDIARGTVYSRLDRLEVEGVITGYGPDIDPSKAGLGVLAFCTLEIAQGSLEETAAALAAIHQVLEVHTVTGPGDVLVRIAARSNDHLHNILQRIAAMAGVKTSETHLALSTNLQRTVADVLAGT
jgi:DNA-binding Lrp family transcriptional regulator